LFWRPLTRFVLHAGHFAKHDVVVRHQHHKTSRHKNDKSQKEPPIFLFYRPNVLFCCATKKKLSSIHILTHKCTVCLSSSKKREQHLNIKHVQRHCCAAFFVLSHKTTFLNNSRPNRSDFHQRPEYARHAR